MKPLILCCVGGEMPTNCFVVKDEESGQSFVVDPGFYDDTLEAALKKANITSLTYILLTHGHFDHILGLPELHERFGGKIVMHKSDEPFLTDDDLSLCENPPENRKFVEKADLYVDEGSVLPFGDREIRVMHTPGHTHGSVCYLLSDVMFSGDTLFASGFGRTDFPTGNKRELLQSVKRIAMLETNYRILPGHAGETTLSREQKTTLRFFCKR